MPIIAIIIDRPVPISKNKKSEWNPSVQSSKFNKLIIKHENLAKIKVSDKYLLNFLV